MKVYVEEILSADWQSYAHNCHEIRTYSTSERNDARIIAKEKISKRLT